MAGLSASGIGSGLDIDGIVRQLMEIERQPLTKLESRISNYDSQLSAYGQLKSALDGFESSMDALSSVKKFQVYSANSGNTDLLTATTDEFAAVGKYSITVDNLAVAHKMGSAGGFTSSTVFGGTAGDQLKVDVGGSNVTVDLSAGKTLAQVKDAINADANNPGVKATILNVSDTEQRLVFTSTESGSANKITVTETNGGANQLGFTDLNVTAADYTQLDAQLTVDGISVTRSSNSIDDVIQGVTLQLKDDTQPGTTFDLDVARDDDAVIESVNGFIKAYNSAMDKLDSFHKEGGSLEGDNTIISIQSQLRDTLNSNVSSGGAFSYLAELGIKTNTKTGDLELDEDALKTAMDEDFDAVANVFGKEDGGVAYLLEKVAHDLTTYDGLLDNRKEGVQERIDNLTEQKENMEYRLELIQERYQKQYGGLDTMLASMQSMGSYLSAQLSSLPGF
jgi:flagellar hook-associated protein 2